MVDLYINGEYIATTEAQPNNEDNATLFFDTNTWGIIEPGDKVKLVRQGDRFAKEHIVTSFTNFVNVYDDKVYGNADRNANMMVGVPFGDEFHKQFVPADPTGYW